MLYENPRMEILKIEVVDVICASVGDPENPNFDGSDTGYEW